MSNILVTGAFGFIGSHLVERLLADGHFVRAVDNLSTNPVPYPQIFEEMGSPADLTFYRMSLEQYAWHGQLGLEVDAIYHLASPVGPAGILQYAGEIVQQVVKDTYEAMRLALMHRCRLVFVSTSEIYGGGMGGLCSETMPCIIQPDVTVRLEYAVAKLAAEIAVVNSTKVTALDAVIIRPFNVAGPRQSGKGGFVLPRFVGQALAGEPLTVFGDGSAVRAFTHVEDIVDGLVLAMDKGRRGQAFNLGNPANKTTILDLAYKVLVEVEFITGSLNAGIKFTDGKSVYGPLYAEASDKYPDARRAMTDLGWQPTRNIEDTIKDVLLYERKRMEVDRPNAI